MLAYFNFIKDFQVGYTQTQYSYYKGLNILVLILNLIFIKI